MTKYGSDLQKAIEEGRAVRRARAKVTAAERAANPPAPEPPKPKPAPRRRYSKRRVEEYAHQIELGIEDCMADMPDIGEDDAAHDIAWSFLKGIEQSEHPQVIAELKRRYDVWLDDIDPLFND